MFRCTLIGHHSWLLATESSRLLVDPLLTPRFGFTDAVELRVYPPRAFDFEAFPPLDAVLITHEHEGHVDVASLDLLDRRIPIYLSSRSSVATRQLLREMRFDVRLAFPGERIDIGSLSLLPMTADQVNHGLIDEWDVLPYLAWDQAGHGSFFSQVDMRVTEAMWKLARTVIERPGLWTHTTNASTTDFAQCWQMPPSRCLHDFVERAFETHRKISDDWEPPAACLVVGGGWAFGGEQSWINRNHFPFENEEAAAVLTAMLPGERVLAPGVGTTVVMEEGRVREIEPAARFVRPAPKQDWPSRKLTGDVEFLESYTPVTGRTDLLDEEVGALREELDAFARHLYGADPFRRLYSLTAADLEGRRPTFAFLLKADADDGAFVVAYEPQSCSFAPVECEDPIEEYLAVYECWATDLLAYLRAEVSPTALSFGRHREWSANPEAFDFTVDAQLFAYMHQLRHPKRFLALYRTLLAALPAPVATIPFADGR